MGRHLNQGLKGGSRARLAPLTAAARQLICAGDCGL